MKTKSMALWAAILTVAITGVTTSPAWSLAGTPRSDASGDRVLDELVALEGNQTDAEIEALSQSGRPVTILVDFDGDYVAAVETPPVSQASPFAIAPVGPGCSTSSACVKAGSSYYGYKGTGTRKVSHPGTTSAFAGDHSTGFWVGNKINLARPNATLKFKTPVKITSLTRS